ncbi:MAG: restriction endonuclease subunit S [Paludibacteraceae bacterium]|nr:restriction endonuclease subunit S [Paludibacteraceae bacterium]
MADIQHLASLTEEDIKNRYITPAIDQAGWRKDQYRMEYPFTDGRIISAGSEYYRGHIRDLVKGTNINNIKEEYLTYMPIPLPPLAEQQRIVAKIEELFEQIDKITK